jgi:hypothetical protein
LKFYADVHRTKKNSERYRITYNADGITFRHVDSLGEIPAESGDRLFMDTLPPQHTDVAIELYGGEWRSIILGGLGPSFYAGLGDGLVWLGYLGCSVC